MIDGACRFLRRISVQKPLAACNYSGIAYSYRFHDSILDRRGSRLVGNKWESNHDSKHFKKNNHDLSFRFFLNLSVWKSIYSTIVFEVTFFRLRNF